MSDLISRSELIKELRADGIQPTKDTSDFIDGWCEGWNVAVDNINNQPTAYDVDKVVEQLEEYRAKFDCASCKYFDDVEGTCDKDCTDALIDGLIDIIRAGGKE